jgi:2-polyprenyl-6-methoxyphenol hydroxylase-like FAD-dependent oxidoreductase
MSAKYVTTSLVPPIDRIVIVGASLAGLRAAEALRDEGFTRHITLIAMNRRSHMIDHPYLRQS